MNPAITSVPAVAVTIDVTSGDLSEGTVSTATLSFPAGAGALTPQVVTVTPVEDNLLDGSQVYTVVLAAINAPLEPNYHTLNPPDVTVTNDDNDVPGFTVTPTSISTNESGTTANFAVRLDSIPGSAVTVTFSGWEPAELAHLGAGLYLLIFGYFANAQLIGLVAGSDALTPAAITRQRRFLRTAVGQLLEAQPTPVTSTRTRRRP